MGCAGEAVLKVLFSIQENTGSDFWYCLFFLVSLFVLQKSCNTKLSVPPKLCCRIHVSSGYPAEV